SNCGIISEIISRASFRLFVRVSVAIISRSAYGGCLGTEMENSTSSPKRNPTPAISAAPVRSSATAVIMLASYSPPAEKHILKHSPGFRGQPDRFRQYQTQSRDLPRCG